MSLKYGLVFGSLVLAALAPGAAAFAGTSGAISIPHPKTGEWCLFSLDHLGPKKLSVGETGSYLIRLENRSTCVFEELELINRLPKKTRFEQAEPKPTDVWRQQYPQGSILEWESLALSPGEERLFVVDFSVAGGPDREARNRICLMNPRYAEEEYCTYFKIRIRP